MTKVKHIFLVFKMSYLGYERTEHFELFRSIKDSVHDDDWPVPVAGSCQQQKLQQQQR